MRELTRRYGMPAARFAVTTVLPAALLAVVAVLIGVVRTAALLGFGVLALLRVGFLGLQRLGELVPGPRFVPANPLGGER